MGPAVTTILFSDIHSNLPALEACWEWVLAKYDPKDLKLVSLGDQIGYGPFPQETLDYLRQIGESCQDFLVLMGNHESALLGYEDTRFWSPTAAGIIAFTKRIITDNSLIVGRQSMVIEGDIWYTHACFEDPSCYDYLLTVDDAEWALRGAKFKIGFFGHTHAAVGCGMRIHNGKHQFKKLKATDGPVDLTSFDASIVNPGSVGQPRDNDPRSSFGVLHDDLTFEWVRVDYDIDRTVNKMIEHSLPPSASSRLYKGQ
jgi:diadenosine tetraphosphatase ApaH/serine/threonine PP2A family protein phosphatase